MSTLARKARTLELARGLVGAAPKDAPGLAWSQTIFEIDRDALRDGERVIHDSVVLSSGSDQPADVLNVERVTSDPDERGVVFARDGREIGHVEVSRRGAVMLHYDWPADLVAPAAPVTSSRAE